SILTVGGISGGTINEVSNVSFVACAGIVPVCSKVNGWSGAGTKYGAYDPPRTLLLNGPSLLTSVAYPALNDTNLKPISGSCGGPWNNAQPGRRSDTGRVPIASGTIGV